MITRTAVVCVAASVTLLTAVGCSAGPESTSRRTEGSGLETTVADGVVVDVVANGQRLAVRNHRAHQILVLDTAMEPHRDERSGTLTLTSVRPGATEGGDEPAIFEAVLVEAHGRSSIDPGFVLAKGDRLRFCLEVVDPAHSIGGEGTRVLDRDPGEPAELACSSPFTAR